MKKAFEVINRPTIDELETRISALEARLEKLDPSPKIETLQPHPIGASVYSVSDLEARYPIQVVGYDRAGHILVLTNPDDPCPRSLPLASVRTLEECPNAAPTPSQAFAKLDRKAREFYEGRRAAQIAAKVAPPPPERPKQRRYFGEQDQIPTWGMRPHIAE